MYVCTVIAHSNIVIINIIDSINHKTTFKCYLSLTALIFSYK